VEVDEGRIQVREASVVAGEPAPHQMWTPYNAHLQQHLTSSFVVPYAFYFCLLRSLLFPSLSLLFSWVLGFSGPGDTVKPPLPLLSQPRSLLVQPIGL